MINTTKGLLPEESLEKTHGVYEDDNEMTEWTEYRLDGEIVHRSVHVHLKQAMFAGGLAGDFTNG